MGARYELSFAYLGPTAIRRLNRTYRGADKPTDALAFPLGRAEGEIVMCKSMIRKKAGAFGMSPESYERFLFIHACLHLKGHSHGRIMERLEDQWLASFRLPGPNR